MNPWAIFGVVYGVGIVWFAYQVRHPAEGKDMLARRCIICHEPCSKEDAWRIRNGATVISGLCGTCRESASL